MTSHQPGSGPRAPVQSAAWDPPAGSDGGQRSLTSNHPWLLSRKPRQGLPSQLAGRHKTGHYLKEPYWRETILAGLILLPLRGRSALGGCGGGIDPAFGQAGVFPEEELLHLAPEQLAGFRIGRIQRIVVDEDRHVRLPQGIAPVSYTHLRAHET